MRDTHRCLAVLSGLALAVASAVTANQKEPVKAEKTGYAGWKNNLKISNGTVELIATLDVGPRIISYRFTGGKNVFKEYKDQLGKSGETTWQIRGGHRLWTAPEDTTRTYALDNFPITFAQQDGTVAVRLIQKPDAYCIQKEIEVRLEPKGTGVTLVHRLTNTGGQETKIAPWALSVMAAGGMEIIPLPPKKPHPGGVTKTTKPSDYWPNQNLALWPFFDFKDSRWDFGSKYITLKQSKRGPTKIGLLHAEGWVGYLNGGTLFVKNVALDAGKTYPDRGCNFETFTNEDMLEVETLGPLVKLGPGETAELLEHWSLFKNVPDCKDEKAIDRHVLPLVRVK